MIVDQLSVGIVWPSATPANTSSSTSVAAGRAAGRAATLMVWPTAKPVGPCADRCMHTDMLERQLAHAPCEARPATQVWRTSEQANRLQITGGGSVHPSIVMALACGLSTARPAMKRLVGTTAAEIERRRPAIWVNENTHRQYDISFTNPSYCRFSKEPQTTVR